MKGLDEVGVRPSTDERDGPTTPIASSIQNRVSGVSTTQGPTGSIRSGPINTILAAIQQKFELSGVAERGVVCVKDEGDVGRC